VILFLFTFGHRLSDVFGEEISSSKRMGWSKSCLDFEEVQYAIAVNMIGI